ncbi:hypothetical protein VTJ49DRAFT_3845 [Mycothermus thermophilus]|uniref:Uncharacterized protein n=1 Tax=Humicola insolens TaxID=85995 RepID=A0ABR3VRB1_HUMIN
MFMGTPHEGSWMAKWASLPAAALGLIMPTNEALLDILETSSEHLESVQVEFWSMSLAK